MRFYVIRHKPSGTLFPIWKGGQRRGSTYINAPFKDTPRLFTSIVAAKNCLRWWLQGQVELIRERDDEWGGNSFVVGAMPGKGDANRKAEDMEILAASLHVRKLK